MAATAFLDFSSSGLERKVDADVDTLTDAHALGPRVHAEGKHVV